MKWFFKKNKVEEKTSTEQKTQINTDQAQELAKYYNSIPQLYIILSTRQADMREGFSIPYVGILENQQKILLIFSTYEYAKKYIDSKKAEVIDNIYPIGEINSNDKFNNLSNLCNIALNNDIQFIDFNGNCNDHTLGCEINWFMNVNKMEKGQVLMVVSKEESERLLNGATTITKQLNPIKICNYVNPYNISTERANEVIDHVFIDDATNEEYIKRFMYQESLSENNFLMDYMQSTMIPKSKNEGKDDMVEYFQEVLNILFQVTVHKLFEQTHLFTLLEPHTNELLIKRDNLYLLYTDRFKYLGKYQYKTIDKVELMKIITENNITNILLTDGPYNMCMIPTTYFRK